MMVGLTPETGTPATVGPWMEMFNAALLTPADPDDVFAWKLKKKIVEIISRYFTRYGTPVYADADLVDLAEWWIANMAVPLLESCMTVVHSRSRGNFCTDAVMQGALCYISSGVEPASTCVLICAFPPSLPPPL